MPFQGSWVEHWLDRYCEPGHHTFAVAKPGIRACRRCGKEEIAGRMACMFCGIPGETLAELVHSTSGLRTQGALCGICRDEFRDRRAIRGWWLARSA